jgi:hypothetical protein
MIMLPKYEDNECELPGDSNVPVSRVESYAARQLHYDYTYVVYPVCFLIYNEYLLL